MSAKQTKEEILEDAKQVLAESGYSGVSMRGLAKSIGISASSIYNHFPSKDDLLKAAYNRYRDQIAAARAELIIPDSLEEGIEQEVKFRFSFAQEFAYVIKYFLHFREEFEKQEGSGYIPQTSYVGLTKVIEKGYERGEFKHCDFAKENAEELTKVIFMNIIEYHPYIPTGKDLEMLQNKLKNFICRSLRSQYT